MSDRTHWDYVDNEERPAPPKRDRAAERAMERLAKVSAKDIEEFIRRQWPEKQGGK